MHTVHTNRDLFRNCLQKSQLTDCTNETIVNAIIDRCNPSQLESYYGIPKFSGSAEFMKLAHKSQKTVSMVIADFISGNIKYYCKPTTSITKVTDSQKNLVKSWTEKITLDRTFDQNTNGLTNLQIFEPEFFFSVNQRNSLFLIMLIKIFYNLMKSSKNHHQMRWRVHIHHKMMNR